MVQIARFISVSFLSLLFLSSTISSTSAQQYEAPVFAPGTVFVMVDQASRKRTLEFSSVNERSTEARYNFGDWLMTANLSMYRDGQQPIGNIPVPFPLVLGAKDTYVGEENKAFNSSSCPGTYTRTYERSVAENTETYDLAGEQIDVVRIVHNGTTVSSSGSCGGKIDLTILYAPKIGMWVDAEVKISSQAFRQIFTVKMVSYTIP